MYPLLLEIGPITFYSLWIFVAVGFFAALLIMNKLIKKCRLSLKFIADHSLAIFFGGLIMARIVFVISNWHIFFSDLTTTGVLQLFYIWDKGLSPWGGILGVSLTLAFFAHREKENVKRWMDVLLTSALGAIAISNIGAFLDGRNYGRETNLPWGVTIESSIYAVPIHPIQIYAAIYSGLLAFILFKLFSEKIGKEDGKIAILALGGYSACRFLEEFLRGDESRYFLDMREAQIFALLGIIISAILFYAPNIKSRLKSKT